MVKPIGAICNQQCCYCYYHGKTGLYPENNQGRVMTFKVLDEFISQYIEDKNNTIIQFIWHGGEPTLCGMDFFKKVLSLQKKYQKQNIIENCIQTNGTLLTDDWCRFFKDNNFLIGLSIDGPEHCHDHYRYLKHGKSSFSRTMTGLEHLKKHDINFNTLTVISDYSSNYPLEIYHFLKNIGSQTLLKSHAIVQFGQSKKTTLSSYCKKCNF